MCELVALCKAFQVEIDRDLVFTVRGKHSFSFERSCIEASIGLDLINAKGSRH